ncbi:hypothetical protein Mapa_000138 [Marchantia paleacea]|nr:hypothetical protein Mapa_000138 [Marchantia paleacea]
MDGGWGLGHRSAPYPLLSSLICHLPSKYALARLLSYLTMLGLDAKGRESEMRNIKCARCPEFRA